MEVESFDRKATMKGKKPYSHTTGSQLICSVRKNLGMNLGSLQIHPENILKAIRKTIVAYINRCGQHPVNMQFLHRGDNPQNHSPRHKSLLHE